MLTYASGEDNLLIKEINDFVHEQGHAALRPEVKKMVIFWLQKNVCKFQGLLMLMHATCLAYCRSLNKTERLH
jgi:hypothetical protein